MKTSSMGGLLIVACLGLGMASMDDGTALADQPAVEQTTVHDEAAMAVSPAAESAGPIRPTFIIDSSGNWLKKTFTIYLNRQETWLLANSPSSFINRLPVPLPVKAILHAYAWLLKSTARNAFNSGQCVLLVTTAYVGWASPPGAAAYTGGYCR